MPSPQRRQKLEKFLLREIGTMLLTEMKDPSIGFVSVVGVAVSSDFRTAKVRVSVFGNEIDKKKNMKALKRARGFIQSRIAANLSMRSVPELIFILDESIEKSIRVGEIISKAVAEDAQNAIQRGEVPPVTGEDDGGAGEKEDGADQDSDDEDDFDADDGDDSEDGEECE